MTSPTVRMRLAGMLFLGGAALASCASNAQTKGYACPDIIQAAPQLIYPVPNATGVPTAAGYLVVDAAVADADVSLVPLSGGNGAVKLGPLVPNPSPIPMPTSTAFAGNGLFGVFHPALASQTTYAVDYEPTTSGRCTSVPGSSGSFTTE